MLHNANDLFLYYNNSNVILGANDPRFTVLAFVALKIIDKTEN